MIAVCLKWVGRRPEVDPLSGEVVTDARTSGASDADLAALEHALRIAERTGDEVTVVTVGPVAAEGLLRDAVAVGAARARRVDAPSGIPSEAAAAALAVASAGADLVLCGAWSLDRGSGAVPALLAAHLGAAQALGLVGLELDGEGVLLGERRLDGGRRERIRARGRVVLSVEPGLRLRRADIDAVLRAKRAVVEVLDMPPTPPPWQPVRVGPYRPRARVLPGPSSALTARERTLALSGVLTDRPAATRLVLDPHEAADCILHQLRAWGYLEP